MEKMTGKSMDLIAENIKQMKALFPEAVTEGKIDFEVLKALLGEEVEKRQTYYKFTWNGKEEARAYARVPSMGTLRPCVEESSGKDGTPGKFDSGNLYIEGDNLEVLKLLQGSYHKRVKMIYIDPPYNTGKDFVYPDNYRNPIGEYKALTGQTDDEGKSTHANSETSGRYHTDWLNMMYPRLILARNLLTDDGVIFISIDDSEQDNLKKLCNEVFGEENFIDNIIWKKRYGGGAKEKYLVSLHEYALMYCKSIDNISELFIPLSQESAETYYSKKDEKYSVRGGYRTHPLEAGKAMDARPNLIYPIAAPDGTMIMPKRQWLWGKERAYEALKNNELEIQKGNAGEWIVSSKQYLKDDDGNIRPGKMFSMIDDIYTQHGTNEMISILGNAKIFSYPKPSALIKKLLQLGSDSDIVLDFFSGSASTAHAVMQLNAEDGGNRKFIMVQLPEKCEEGTEAAKAGYKNICEIGKERIRRAAKKIKDENPLFAGDMGFKVFKLDTSNIVPWNPNADELRENLLAVVDNVLANRTTQDLLYEVLLKCNLPLTLSIEEKKFGENTVYIVGSGMLAICLDKTIPQTIAEEIVKLRDEYAPIVPMQVVFRDNGFTDVAKTNVLQILQQAGFEDKSVQTI
ncbi:MAG: site-specific DNA-methyltransferase [Victivallales bacterium]|nr:site-specific DNA-methyltransferase [Victivallales bacterium]